MSDLISTQYIQQLQQLHAERPTFGASGGKVAGIVMELCRKYETKDVLDYGCGKRELAKALPFPIQSYDPAIPAFDMDPEPADIVVANDVLEHVEEFFLEAVLDDLKRCVKKAGYFLVATRPAKKTLPDGRNSHICLHDAEWWLEKLRARFQIVSVEYDGEREFSCVVEALRP